MITLIKRQDGGYSLFGTENDVFFVQGNLTVQQLTDLRDELNEALTKEANEKCSREN